MKVVLATSEVTYVPENYLGLFQELLSDTSLEILGLFVLKNLSLDLFKQLVGLGLIGCTQTAATLARNIVKLPLGRREGLFKERSIPVFRAKSMNDQEVVRWIRQNQIDLVVNLRTRCIYRRAILEAPRLGCINVHHGLLPEYRGTLCDLYALSEGRPAGFTIHVMNEKIDDGRILLRQEVSRPGEKRYVDYLARTGHEEGRALSKLLSEIARTNSLPEGLPNRCEKPVHTRNPDRRVIRRMREGGMVL